MSRERPFIVGANMPWGRWCGHDFGLRPHGWGTARQDWSVIRAELEALRSLGVTVVRWFILGSGVNYPCRDAAEPARQPGPDGRVAQAVDDHARRVPLARARALPRSASMRREFEFEWRGPPPRLSEAFVDDFIALCHACQHAGVQLLPSLLSFEWFQPALHKDKGVYAGGRRRLILGPPGTQDVAAHVRAFLDATLVPLITRSTQTFGPATRAAASQHPIFAWESINEPDWVTEGGPRLLFSGPPLVSAGGMSTLLAACRRVVLDAGYDHSIGFKQFSPDWLDPGLRRALVDDGERYWHQGHHYPTAAPGRLVDEPNRTLPAKSREFQNCLVGEFPTGRGPHLGDLRSFLRPGNWYWRDPELQRSEALEERFLEGRLSLMVQRGYDGAFFWSAKPSLGDGRNRWDANTQAQLARFARTLAADGTRPPLG